MKKYQHIAIAKNTYILLLHGIIICVNMINFFKKYHKWLSIILSFFIVLFALSGIILNHRELFSPIDVNRNYLPKYYQIKNWNNASVKSVLKISDNNYLIYGNIGIWKTDSNFSTFEDYNNGLPTGIDNRKISSMFYSSDKHIYAATLFGFFVWEKELKEFKRVILPTHEQRVVDIIEKDSKLFLLTRSLLVIANLEMSDFEIIQLPPPQNYDNKIGLFKTLWVIHSGEIYGTIGKIIVDFVGLIFIFLTITGLIIFINRKRIIKRAKNKSTFNGLKRINLWNLRWHNKIGWTTVILLIITTFTGIFLRPPLLISIANTRVGKIPRTELATPNPWFDQLRRIIYDNEKDRFIISTLYGFYYSDDNFQTELIKYKLQPPASVMGVNVLRKTSYNTYLVGSFEGLFEWRPEQGTIYDHIKNEKWHKPKTVGPPIGEYLVTAYFDDNKGKEIVFDYNKGAININGDRDFAALPKTIKSAYRMSLWNLGLEIHTGRFYEFIFGKFYILIIPIAGLSILFILISGFVVWWKIHRKIKY